MGLLDRLWQRLRREADLDEEIGAHLGMAARDRVARGEDPDQARFDALREFGNPRLVKEITRDMWGRNIPERLGQDLRYAVRIARKNVAFSAVVVLTLALGIGANTAIFSVVHAAMAPLHIAQPERAAMVWTENPGRDWRRFPASVPDYRDWGASGVFSAIGGFNQIGVNLRLADVTERIDGIAATGGIFGVLSTPPLLGRVFRDDDTQSGSRPVAILSEKFWRSRFAADPAIIGKSLVIDGAPHTVVGVLSKRFPALGSEQIYVPLIFSEGQSQRGDRFFGVMGRLRAGVTIEAAQQRLTTLSKRLALEYPNDDVGNTALLQPLEEAWIEDSKMLLIILFSAVGFVLLIACANIANLLLARGTTRAKEMALRAALGATRATLARQLLAESVLLAVLGGLAAIPVAFAAVRFIASRELDLLPNPDLMNLNPSVLAFNAGISLLTGIFFGLVPAWQARKTNVSDTLKASARCLSGRIHQRLRSVFVVGEIALTLMLLLGAGLMVQSFLAMRDRNPGYQARGVLTLRVAMASAKYADEAKRVEFIESMVEQARRLPGVQSAGAINSLPTADDLSAGGLYFPGRPKPRQEDVPVALRCSVTGGYFEAMRIPLLRGRYLNDDDQRNSQPVAVVDEWTAKRFWPNGDTLGQQIQFGLKPPVRQIVGIVGTVEQPVLETLSKGKTAQVYLPFEQMPGAEMSLAIRTAGDTAPLASAMRAIALKLDVDQPIFDVKTMEAARAAGQATQRLVALLLTAFAGLALLLASLGVYGVIAYNATQRMREFGIRLSLGARKADILLLVIRQGALMSAAGLGIGLAGAFGVARLMKGFLYGVGEIDPRTFAAVAGLLALVALAASSIPARRPAKVDPMLALRCE